jgi:hypothetical protein
MRDRIGDDAVHPALFSELFAAKQGVHQFRGELAGRGAFALERRGIRKGGAERRTQNAARSAHFSHCKRYEWHIAALTSELEKTQVVTRLAGSGRDLICSGGYALQPSKHRIECGSVLKIVIGDDERDRVVERESGNFCALGGLNLKVENCGPHFRGILQNGDLLVNGAGETAMVLLETASRKQMNVGIAFVKRANEIDAGGRISQVIESKFEEGGAVLVFGFSSAAQFGRGGEAQGDADARKGARERGHEPLLDQDTKGAEHKRAGHQGPEHKGTR